MSQCSPQSFNMQPCDARNIQQVKAVLSTQVSTPGVIFARGTFESASKHDTQRPSSAPASRSMPAGDGSGLFNLQGDEKVLSKYKNVTVVRWGPPGR